MPNKNVKAKLTKENCIKGLEVADLLHLSRGVVLVSKYKSVRT